MNSNPDNPNPPKESEAGNQTSQANNVPSYEAATYSSLGNQITGWTSNLLASALVIMIALVGGKQLVSSWSAEDPSGALSENHSLVDAWPLLESCSLEFGDSPLQMDYSKFKGDRENVYRWLQSKCVSLLQEGASPVDSTETVGINEAKMIDQCADINPIQQEKGKWRVFRVGDDFAAKVSAESSASSQLDSSSPQGDVGLPMVIGIRDDCSGEKTSRLVTWGMALPVVADQAKTTEGSGATKLNKEPPRDNTKTWKTYVSSSVSGDQIPTAQATMKLLPPGSSRTLAIKSTQSGSLVGFSGGFTNDAIEFFNHLQRENEWSVAKPWSRQGSSWSVRYTCDSDDAVFKSIQIQMRSQDDQELRGMLMLQANETLAKKGAG